jgi:hypothetical protein
MTMVYEDYCHNRVLNKGQEMRDAQNCDGYRVRWKAVCQVLTLHTGTATDSQS